MLTTGFITEIIISAYTRDMNTPSQYPLELFWNRYHPHN